MYRRIGGNGGHRLILNSFDSWLMHPLSKPANYIKHLPDIINLIHSGKYPTGHTAENLELNAWLQMIKKDVETA